MKHMEFRHKDINVRVHTSLMVTRLNGDQKHEMVYASIIDIDSRIQAVFAQFHHSRKASDVAFWIRHAPRIGEKEYDRSNLVVYPKGNYKHLSQRENDTFVTGLVASERVLSRTGEGFIIFAWDGNIHEKLYHAIDAYYETPMLEEWTPYLYRQLINDQLIVPLVVHDYIGDHPDLIAYELLAGEDALDSYISFGLRSGAIVLAEDVKEAI
ncbi:hypothetical protein [Paenibacillus sp. MMO-177]|uniref:hypothetical protein n=1 Tax=Paenibacillus sp. MMO-177 TaxID=3081289 RepID=UPI003016DE18